MSGTIKVESNVSEIAAAMTEGQRQHMTNHLLKHYDIKPQRIENAQAEAAYAEGRKAGHEEAHAECYLEAFNSGMFVGYSDALADVKSEITLLEKRT